MARAHLAALKNWEKFPHLTTLYADFVQDDSGKKLGNETD
jgi:hypothetical protein